MRPAGPAWRSTSSSSKGSSKSSSSKSSSSSSSPDGGGGGLDAEVMDLLKEIHAGVQANAEKIEEIEGVLAELEPFIKETHYGFSCIALGDEALASNFEDPAVQEDLLGKLALGEGDDDDEGEE